MVVVVKSRHREHDGLLRFSRGRPLRLHSLSQKEAGHLMSRQTEKTRILIFYDLNKKEEKAKYMICM